MSEKELTVSEMLTEIGEGFLRLDEIQNKVVKEYGLDNLDTISTINKNVDFLDSLKNLVADELFFNSNHAQLVTLRNAFDQLSEIYHSDEVNKEDLLPVLNLLNETLNK